MRIDADGPRRLTAGCASCARATACSPSTTPARTRAYGLTQGTLDGNLLTCAWHNWKFRVDDGACVLGEEDVRTHPVTVDADGTLHVTLVEPDPATLRPTLLASLRRGIERDYVGQVSRDVVRLLRADTNPGEMVWEAVAHGAPRAEFGWGHSIASATDCLAMVDFYDGDQRALPIVQGIAGIAETERDRPVNALPDPASTGRPLGGRRVPPARRGRAAGTGAGRAPRRHPCRLRPPTTCGRGSPASSVTTC